MRRDIAVTTGAIRKGKLLVRSWPQFASGFTRVRDCDVFVRIERIAASRSLQQLRWYWGCIVQLVADHTGYTPDEIHEICKAKFLPKRLAVANGNGEIVGEFVIGGSTGQLTTEEMAAYCTSIQQWAAEDLDIVIPDPDTESVWR